jgi:APA family basic amino acid/polyamine antiporter
MATIEEARGGPSLVRVMGRLDLTALVVNSVIGSGIFGLPVLLIALIGSWSPLAYLLAAALIAVIALCFAEVASRFRAAGGAYLYAREAFGSFVGLQVGWVSWLVRIASAAANANLFVLYLAELWGAATRPEVRLLLLTLIFLALTAVNYRGVHQGAEVSNVFTVAKLAPLAVFGLVGLFFLRGENFSAHAAAATGDWPQAMMLLVFAYGGFESAMIPAGEMKHPRRDTPFALLVGLAVVALTYAIIQTVVVGTLPAGIETDRPLATAAHEFLGAGGGLLLAVGALLSVTGLLSTSMLNSPRLTYALAEQGDFPTFFAAVHPRFRTPHVSIVVYAILSWGLAVWGSFEWNAVLSAVARLLIYLSTCIALMVLRRRTGAAAAFRVPAGPLLSLVGVAFCVWLLLQMGRQEFLILAATALLAAGTWWWARRARRGTRPS